MGLLVWLVIRGHIATALNKIVFIKTTMRKLKHELFQISWPLNNIKLKYTYSSCLKLIYYIPHSSSPTFLLLVVSVNPVFSFCQSVCFYIFICLKETYLCISVTHIYSIYSFHQNPSLHYIFWWSSWHVTFLHRSLHPLNPQSIPPSVLTNKAHTLI